MLDIEKDDVVRCPGCAYVEYVMTELLPTHTKAAKTEANSASVDSALRFIRDAHSGLHKYQGHRVRVGNQRLSIANLHRDCREEAIARYLDETTVHTLIINLDFKMKFTETRLRESQIHNYGKRGFTWHEIVATYYSVKVDLDSPEEFTVEKTKFSLDQILNNGNKQDGNCVVSMLEAFCVKIDNACKGFTHGIFYSDNALAYHAPILIAFIPLINAKLNKFKIVRFTHTETQDGKGDCDAHGAIAERHIDLNWIRKREDKLDQKKVTTQEELIHAIACEGGIQNNCKSTSHVIIATSIFTTQPRRECTVPEI